MENISLIAKHFSGNLTAREKQVLDNWRQLDQRNEKAFREFEKIWIASGKHIARIDIDTAVEWSKFKAKILGAQTNGTSINRRNLWTAAAAAVILALAGLSTIFLLQKPVPLANGADMAIATSRPQFIEMISADSAQVFFLPDSSRIFLNQNSRLSYMRPFLSGTRRAYLKGEAYFEVRKNAQPFIVYTGGTQISVLGTAFNVRADSSGTTVELVVIEGKAAFREQGAPAASEVVLQSNDMITFNQKEKRITRGTAGNIQQWWEQRKWGETFDWTGKRDALFKKIRKKLR